MSGASERWSWSVGALVAAVLVWLGSALGVASASAQERQLVHVMPVQADVSPQDQEALRQMLIGRLNGTGRVQVVAPGVVESRLFAYGQQQGQRCTAFDRWCVGETARSVGVQIVVVPSLVSWESGYGRRVVTLSVQVFDVSYSWSGRSFSEEGLGASIWDGVQRPLGEIVEEIVDFVETDPWLRSSEPAVADERLWFSIQAVWVLTGAGRLRLEEPGASAEVEWTDDTLYGFNLRWAWLESFLAFGVEVGWLPSVELELDGVGRASVRSVDTKAERSFIGEANEGSHELDLNLVLELYTSVGELFGDSDLKELVVYGGGAGGFSFMVLGEERAPEGLPWGWNLAGEIGVQGMTDRQAALRFGLRAQYVDLRQSLKSTPEGEALDVRATGMRWMLVFGILGGP